MVLVGEIKNGCANYDSDYIFFDVWLQDESSVTLVYFTTDMCVLHYCCYLMDRLNSEVRTCSIQGRCGVDPALAHFHGFSFTMIRSLDMRCCHCIEIIIIEPIKKKRYIFFKNNKTNVT